MLRTCFYRVFAVWTDLRSADSQDYTSMNLHIVSRLLSLSPQEVLLAGLTLHYTIHFSGRASHKQGLFYIAAFCVKRRVVWQRIPASVDLKTLQTCSICP
jgi:hypothetical protein